LLKWGLGGMALVLASGAVAFGIVSTGGGSVSAQTPGSGAGPGHYEEVLAEKLGISVEELQAAQKAARDQLIDEAVDEGRLTEEQGEKLKSMELGAMKRPFMMRVGQGAVHAIKGIFSAAAEVIGIEEDDLAVELRSGKSLLEIAEDNDVDRDELTEGLIENLTEAIEEANEAGKITDEQAERLLSNLEENIDRIIEREGGVKLEGGMPLGPRLDRSGR
jgi:hypothetical protein